MAEIERVTARDPRIGEVVGERYRLVRLLAQGGMGRVYVGEHVDIGMRVAVKLLPIASEDEKLVKRFRHEAIAGAQLRSPHVVQVFDFGRTRDGAFYLVMELLEGRDLATVIAEDGLPDGRRTIGILRQIARALDLAHANGIVHRDLKPENVFVVDGSVHPDFVKVLDFGVAKSVLRSNSLTDAGTVLGTPAYMAPEQAIGRSEIIGPAADRYGLTALALELITGATPYPEAGPARTLRALLDESPRLPSELGVVIDGLDDVFARGLSRNPDARYSTATELVEALAKVLEAGPEHTPADDAGERRASTIRSVERKRARRSDVPTRIGTGPAPSDPAALISDVPPAARVPAEAMIIGAPTPSIAPAAPPAVRLESEPPPGEPRPARNAAVLASELGERPARATMLAVLLALSIACFFAGWGFAHLAF